MHTTALFTLPLLLSASLASAQEVVVGGSCDLRLRDTDCNSAGEQLFCSTTMNDDRIRWIYEFTCATDMPEGFGTKCCPGFGCGALCIGDTIPGTTQISDKNIQMIKDVPTPASGA